MKFILVTCSPTFRSAFAIYENDAGRQGLFQRLLRPGKGEAGGPWKLKCLKRPVRSTNRALS